VTSVNWGAAGVALVVGGAAVEAFRRAVQSPDILYRLYHEDQARTRAAIESEHVLPQLASLVSEVIGRVRPVIEAGPADDGQETLDAEVQDSLQSVDYLERLEELSQLYGDHRDASGLSEEAQRWSRRKGWSALVFLAGFLGLISRVILHGVTWPQWPLYPAGAFALIGLTVGVTSWAQEISIRNKLVGLFKKYE
jgi:hypothetical protein